MKPNNYRKENEKEEENVWEVEDTVSPSLVKYGFIHFTPFLMNSTVVFHRARALHTKQSTTYKCMTMMQWLGDI